MGVAVTLLLIGGSSDSRALTGGPTEPAASGPAAVSVDGLVDPFTGDFQYSIPLFDLPGPRGSYPFAIRYRSGIQTEQEASWVGLGWSFEPGRISRSVRGLPDDLAGDDINQLFRQREARAYGASGTVGVEVFGLDNRLLQIGGNVGLEVFFDSYAGYGLGLVLSTSAGVRINDNLGANLGVSADLNTHHGTTVGSTLGLNIGMGKLNPSYGAAFNPTTGLESAYWGYGNIPLFSPAYVAAAQRAQWGDRVDFSIKVGGELWGVFPEGKVSGYYSTTRYSVPKSVKGYGYLHLEDVSDSSTAQLDFLREKDGPLKPNTPYLPFTTLASDEFEVTTSAGPTGAFRAYRNDLPVVGDQSVGSANVSFSESVEVGSGALVHGGVSAQLATAESASSRWRPGGFVSAIGAAAAPSERAYFAMISELTTDEGVTHADEARFIQLSDTHSASATLVGLTGQSSTLPLSPIARPRATRIRAVTEQELLDGNYRSVGQFTYRHIKRPAGIAGARIAGFEVTQPDGTRYVFAQPAYVEREISCTFSVDPSPTGFLPGQTTVKVAEALKAPLEAWFADPASDPSISLPATTDQFLTCTPSPRYAHSYHLTSVLGPDYVDVSSDGPTDDDLGYWVRFEYVEVSGYAYRSPYNGAHYERGFEHSYLTDDRGTFTYGRKQLFFLGRATTGSHQALFALSDAALAKAKQCAGDDSFLTVPISGRSDARGAWQVVQNSGAPTSAAGVQPRLLGAFLCRRGDNVPVKSAYLQHDYELAVGVPNGDSTKGKLTLKKVWFEHGRDTSGRRSPYEFTYQRSSGDNPRYQQPDRLGDKNSDRWGFFQKCQPRPSFLGAADSDQRCSNGEQPYTRQFSASSGSTDENPSAWSLRAITTPSRARIEVDYEPDDYAFVQDQRSAVMVPGSVFTPGSSGAAGSCGEPIPTGQTSAPIFCVDLAKLGFASPPSTAGEAQQLADALLKNADGQASHIAFSADVRLRALLGAGDMWGPIRGYVEPTNWQVDPVAGCNSAKCELQIKLVPSTVKGKNYHPLAFAGWQHLKRNQPQYAIPGVSPPSVYQSSTDQLKSQATGLVQMVLRLKDVFDDFAERASGENWANQARNIQLRLFMPTGRKRGGGVRVAHVRLCDAQALASGQFCDANNPSLTIGKSYVYEMPEETAYTGRPISSGVAAYEPSVGGDEISLRRPHYFKDKNAIWAPSDPTYFEFPLAESLYPAPVVGYRRVAERTFAGAHAAKWFSDHPDLPPLSLAGERVHEFYTAKDYPVRAEGTAVQKPTPVQEVASIPGIGTILREEFAASQGYRVELNDMHGKPRQVTEFSLRADGKPVEGSDRQTTYFYNITGRRIDPSVPAVHLRSATPRSATSLGQRVEYYADLRQSVSSTNNTGLSMNADVMQIGPWPVPIPVPWPAYDDSEKESRMSVFHQVVHRNAVLRIVETKDRSITTHTENLAFDFTRGAPLLTSTTNAFGDPVFDLAVPAYWLHKGMEDTASYQIAATAITLRSATHPFAAPEGRCCQPDRTTTVRVSGVLDASATIFGRRHLVPEPLLFHYAPALRVQEDTKADLGLWDELLGGKKGSKRPIESKPWDVWRPLVNYRIDDVRKYADRPSPRTDGRFTRPVTIPLAELAEPDAGAATSRDPSVSFMEPVTTFDRLAATCTDSRWVRSERFIGYHPHGPALHSVTPLARQDAILYGRDAAVVQAVGQNAAYSEIGFESFESYAPGKQLTFQSLDDGNIDFWTIFDVAPVVQQDSRIPGQLRDGVIVWEPGPGPPFHGGDIDPVPPDITVRIDSYLGESFVLRPRIDRLERRGPQLVAVPREPIPFTDRQVTVGLTRYVKVVGIEPPHLRQEPKSWVGGLRDWLGIGKTPRVKVTASRAHTGTKSLAIEGNAVYGQTRLVPRRPGTYVISAWVSRLNTDAPTFMSAPDLDVSKRLGVGVVVGGSVTEDAETKESLTSGGVSHFFEPAGPAIDGWQRIEGEFYFGTVGEPLTIYLQSGDASVVYVDDLRVFPREASLQTFVYEPRTLRLIARLDDNNMATRWQYDHEYQLRFAERETERGWRTVREHLNHLVELPAGP